MEKSRATLMVAIVLMLVSNLFFFIRHITFLTFQQGDNSRQPNIRYINITVAHNGLGTVKSIGEAIGISPDHNIYPYIIFIKAGKYVEENLVVGEMKTNLWFVGEGRGLTIITGNKSVGHDKIATRDSATFSAWGEGLVLQDITFENSAGPANHQAVALLVAADRAVIYRCEMKGYQDTLYTYRGRQFYRECDIYGTVDYIFGDAASIFQNCTMWARKPMVKQANVITAQGRAEQRRSATGIVIHACQFRAAPDLEPLRFNFKTYLGRPWRKYATVVYMESFLGDHIEPSGWLEWNETIPILHQYYGEFQNVGPGADISQRVRWPSVHPKMTWEEAQNFTVAQFIQGQTWIKATGVPYEGGLLA